MRQETLASSVKSQASRDSQLTTQESQETRVKGHETRDKRQGA